MNTRVYIAIPTIDGNVNVNLAKLAMTAARGSGEYDFVVRFFMGYRPVAYMRNAQFGDFLASDCDVLWLLDQDIIPPPSAFEILDVDADIVGGMIPIKKVAADHGGFVLQVSAFRNGADGELHAIPLPDPADSGPSEPVDAVGAGCMVIRREVLEDERMRRGASNGAPAIYHVPLEPSGMMQTSGDVEFCTRAKACGYEIRLWTGEMFGQRETLDLRDVAVFGSRCASAMTEVMT